MRVGGGGRQGGVEGTAVLGSLEEAVNTGLLGMRGALLVEYLPSMREFQVQASMGELRPWKTGLRVGWRAKNN